MNKFKKLKSKIALRTRCKTLYNKCAHVLRPKSYVTHPLIRSATDNGLYPSFCRKAVLNDKVFANYKRAEIYTQVLEHTSYEQGQDYLNIIKKDSLLSLDENTMTLCYANDQIGNPQKCYYENLGTISPSNLRYLKVCSDLKKYFGSLEGLRLAEIGAGYGGQTYYTDALLRPLHFTLFDLPDVLLLIQRYLENFLLHSSYTLSTLNQFQASEKPFDLVISNYAFSELPNTLQTTYLTKVIAASKRGYLTINKIYNTQFVKEDNLPLSFKKLQTYLPHARCVKLSQADEENYLVIWGENS